MDEKLQQRLLESAPPEARAGYEKLARAGLLTPEMLLAMAALAESLDKFRPQSPGEAPPRTLRQKIAEEVAEQHGLSPDEVMKHLDLFGG